MFTFTAMEIAFGVAGLAGLFGACRDAIEQIDTYKKFGFESRYITAQFELNKQIFQIWANNVGICDTTMQGSHHPNLNNVEIASIVKKTLLSIREIFDGTVDASSNLRLELVNDNLFSSTNVPGSLSKRPINLNQSQISTSKRSKIGWALGGKNNFVKQVEVFGDLIEKLQILVPLRSVGELDSRLIQLEKSFMGNSL